MVGASSRRLGRWFAVVPLSRKVGAAADDLFILWQAMSGQKRAEKKRANIAVDPSVHK